MANGGAGLKYFIRNTFYRGGVWLCIHLLEINSESQHSVAQTEIEIASLWSRVLRSLPPNCLGVQIPTVTDSEYVSLSGKDVSPKEGHNSSFLPFEVLKVFSRLILKFQIFSFAKLWHSVGSLRSLTTEVLDFFNHNPTLNKILSGGRLITLIY